MNDTIEETDIAARLANVNMQLSEEAIRYVKENPDEEASVVLIQSFFSDPDDTRKIDELLALLNPRLKDFLSGEGSWSNIAPVRNVRLWVRKPQISP